MGKNYELGGKLKTIPKILIILMIGCYAIFAEKQTSISSMDAIAERIGAGSRELAKGNAAVADSSAFLAAYWNPGMLAFKRDLSIALHGENRSLEKTGGSFGIESGIGNRMGIGTAFLFRDDMDFMLGYTGLGYRLSKADGIGISLSITYDMLNEYQSPLSLDLGWFRFWNEKWQSGLQIRNLGFNELRPKIFEAGITHRNLLLGKPASVSLSLASYQAADTLSVFEPDWHIFKSRFGFEWRAIANGDLRFGIDGKNPSMGCGYAFRISEKTFIIDYAFIYEWEADLLNPLSFTIRMRF
jgi:hypothetical protein